MKRILLKLFINSIIMIVILFLYVFNDPFKLLYHYDSYYTTGKVEYMGLNKDVISTETFLNNYKKYYYDSYIFGNSRSIFYLVSDWKKHITAKECFHFDASEESLYGIDRKFQFLDDKGVTIKNALIVFDYEAIKNINNGIAHYDKKDPELSRQNKVIFQLSYLQDFANGDFLYPYMYFIFEHKMTATMQKSGLFTELETTYDPVTNEMSFPKADSEISKDEAGFYKKKSTVFYKRNTIQLYSPPAIGMEQKIMCYDIKKILNKQNTNYRIVISPLYNQVKLDTTDLKTLYLIFGKENVYDFSGINYMTQNIHNYYEDSHYRPFLCTDIMNIIYKK
jgi:hypothetical protein